MRSQQVRLIAEMITDDPDVFFEEASGMAAGGQAAGGISKPGPAKRMADTPTAQPGGTAAADAKPLNATEIQKQAADDTGGDNPAAQDVMANQMKVQQDMEKQQQVERQKILKPQFDRLNSAMSRLQQGVLQGKQAATSGGEQFGALEKEMTSLNTLLGNIQKQM
jgi:hypothetical protein